MVTLEIINNTHSEVTLPDLNGFNDVFIIIPDSVNVLKFQKVTLINNLEVTRQSDPRSKKLHEFNEVIVEIGELYVQKLFDYHFQNPIKIINKLDIDVLGILYANISEFTSTTNIVVSYYKGPMHDSIINVKEPVSVLPSSINLVMSDYVNDKQAKLPTLFRIMKINGNGLNTVNIDSGNSIKKYVKTLSNGHLAAVQEILNEDATANDVTAPTTNTSNFGLIIGIVIACVVVVVVVILAIYFCVCKDKKGYSSSSSSSSIISI